MYICILNLTTPVEVMAKVCVILDHPSLKALIGQAVSEEKMFEIVDDDDDDHEYGRRRMGIL